MFKFGKQKSKKKPSNQLEIDPGLEPKIHIMPQRFYQAPKKSHAGLMIIIVLGLLLIGGLVALAIYLNSSLQAGQPGSVDAILNEDININQPPPPEILINQNVDTNSNLNANLNTNANEDINANANTNENINSNINSNLNSNSNANINQNISRPLPAAPDLDGDGLTDAEESLFGTNPELNDTDGDGYSDGSELLSGYDPTRPQLKLAESDLFGSYNHPIYSIIYPNGWEVKARDDQKNEVLFTSSSGEFVEVLVVENIDNLSLKDWYQKQYPGSDMTPVRSVTINNLAGLRQPDNQSYYLAGSGNVGKIYLLIYNTGNIGRTSFSTTFQVMAKSFKLLP